MRIRRSVPGLILAAAICGFAASTLAQAPIGSERHVAPSPAETLATDAADYRVHITTLANPFMEGRAPGTRGNRVAADYIEFNLKALGLAPAFALETTLADGTKATKDRADWRQPFVAPSSAGRPTDTVRLGGSTLAYTPAGGAEVRLTPGTDYNVLGYSHAGDLRGPLAFAGYSIDEGNDDYSSYPKGADLTGKIAIVLRFEPMDEQGKSKWADVRWSANAGLDSKLRAAAERGAAGIILVNAPGADDDRVNKLDDLSLAGNRPMKVPVVMMSIAAADALVKSADAEGRSLLDLRKLADAKGGVIDLPRAEGVLNVDIQRVPLMTDNVGGILAGSGALKDEYIVIGSHYDHVGYGMFGSRDGAKSRGKIHAGADDNASGTSGNLLVARKLAQAYAAMPAETPRRSVLFLWFSAEESGLVGSRWYVNHPAVPLEQHALMLNMDMIGRLRDGKLEVGGVGTSEGLAEWCEPYWDSSGLVIKPTRIGAPNSDHYSFHLKGVPNLFFFTGLHKEYHSVEDVVATINMEGAASVADLVYRLALDGALRPEPFARGKPTAHGDDEDEDKPQGPLTGIKVRFGIMPGDYSGEKPGVLIGDLSGPDLPAAKAGLKGGDRMTKWNGQDVADVQGWMKFLGQHKPGDKVTVTYIRTVDGVEKEQTAEVELTAAPSNRRQ